MHRTRRRVGAWLVGGLMLGGVAGSAAWAGWPFTGWSIDPERFAGGPITMLVYEGGTPVAERTFPEDSPQAVSVRRWLADHTGSWNSDLNTYIPHRYFSANKFMLNFQGGYVILNYELNGSPRRWSQGYRRVVPGDVPELFGPPRAR